MCPSALRSAVILSFTSPRSPKAYRNTASPLSPSERPRPGYSWRPKCAVCTHSVRVVEAFPLALSCSEASRAVPRPSHSGSALALAASGFERAPGSVGAECCRDEHLCVRANRIGARTRCAASHPLRPHASLVTPRHPDACQNQPETFPTRPSRCASLPTWQTSAVLALPCFSLTTRVKLDVSRHQRCTQSSPCHVNILCTRTVRIMVNATYRMLRLSLL